MTTMARALLLALALLASTSAAARAPVERLPALNARLHQSSVSGVSAGADLAHQLHIAYSDIMVGAGLVSVAPYHCAAGRVSLALYRCMSIRFLARLDPAVSLNQARAFERAGEIDPLANLVDDRVYLFSGTEDDTRIPEVVRKTRDLYRLLGVSGAQIHYRDDLPAGHAFITEDRGNPRCEVSRAPFINDCDYDQAGAILQWLYGDLAPPSATPDGRLIAFDQREFIADPRAASMGEVGYAYIPAACEAGGCRVHVALHGCRQSASMIGDAFYRHAGYNEWADSNRIIVLYPQARASTARRLGVIPDLSESNPRGCWNWWGYADDDHYSRRSGVQMRAIRSMIDRLSAGSRGRP